MCKRLIVSASVLVMVLTGVASAVVVDGYQEWTVRTQLADIGGLEITATGHAKFTARVDQDAVDVTIATGGILETNDTYKLPDDHPEPTRTNVYVNGTWNANNIESKGTGRAAYIYVGATGVINLAVSSGDNADYDPQTWLADNSLLVDPSLDPAAWFIQITDMGGGAAQITAEALAPQVGFDSEASGDLESVSPAELTVTLSGAEEGQTYTVDYAVTGGTAEGAGVDYTLEAGTLTFNPGETTQTISIDIINDGLDEEDETITVELSNASGGDVELAAITQHTYTIKDPRPEVGFEADNSGGMEVEPTANIVVGLSFPSAETVTVDYAVTGGTATGGGVDYTMADGTLTFNPGQTTMSISLVIVDDGVDEDNETIVVTLSDPTRAKLGSVSQHTYTIFDLSGLHLQVDLGLPMCGSTPDTTITVPGTVKEGWWGRVFWGDTDMYMHDFAWEDGSRGQNPPDTPGVDGSGVHFALANGRAGNAGYHVHGMCRCNLAGGCCATGSPSGDPIANGWFHNIDWGGECRGDIHMRITGLPPGEYELISYHNHWEPCSQGSRNCLNCNSEMPPMTSVRARSLGAVDDDCSSVWEGAGTGSGVTSLVAAYNIDVTSVLTDDNVATSTIEFETDGSDVLVVYEGGDNTYPDPARPGREGHKGILNAFELKLVSAAGCKCLGDVADTGGFGEPDGKVDIGDLNALLFAMLGAYPDGDPTGLYEIDAAGLPCGADVSDTGGFGDPDGKVDIGDLNALLFAMLGAYPDGDLTGIYEVPCL